MRARMMITILDARDETEFSVPSLNATKLNFFDVKSQAVTLVGLGTAPFF